MDTNGKVGFTSPSPIDSCSSSLSSDPDSSSSITTTSSVVSLLSSFELLTSVTTEKHEFLLNENFQIRPEVSFFPLRDDEKPVHTI